MKIIKDWRGNLWLIDNYWDFTMLIKIFKPGTGETEQQ